MGLAKKVESSQNSRWRSVYTREEVQQIKEQYEQELDAQEEYYKGQIKKRIQNFKRYKTKAKIRNVSIGLATTIGVGTLMAFGMRPDYKISADSVMYESKKMIWSDDTISQIARDGYQMGRNSESFKNLKAYQNYLLTINGIMNPNIIYRYDTITIPVVVDKEIYNQLIQGQISEEDALEEEDTKGKTR